MTVRELGALLRKGEVSCLELVDAAIARAKERASLCAFITVTETQARTEASERDRELKDGFDRGPLHGIPIALKDLFYTRGVKTTAGSRLYEHFIPDFDGTVVERMRAAGAVSIGKTNLHELAFGITSLNPYYGFVRNPRNEAHLAGGSSGGSAAAIAAGIAPVALGTDTGGSIRIPAAFCGIVGLKPTYGAVSRRGVLPLAFSLDHMGPLGSCVEDCAFAFAAMTERVGNFDLSVRPDLKGLRVGVPRHFFFEKLDEEVAAAVKRSISSMEADGAHVIEVDTPDMNQVNLASRVVQLAEFAALHVERHNPAMFGADVWSFVEQGRMIAGHEYVNAQRIRTVFRAQMDTLWENVNILAVPTTAVAAPPTAAETVSIKGTEETVRIAATRLVRGINYLGEPALSMPCGQTAAGLPIGLQLISAPHTEARLLQIAGTLERILGRFPFQR